MGIPSTCVYLRISVFVALMGPLVSATKTVSCPLTSFLPPSGVTEPLVFSKAQRLQNEDYTSQPSL